MNFVSHLTPGKPYDVSIIHRPTEWIHSVTLGHCTDDGVQVKAIVSAICDPPYETPPNMVELMFMISFTDTNGTVLTKSNGLETKKYLSGEDRTTALGVICIETNKVIRLCNADVVGLSTCYPNLPGKALTKFRSVCAAVRHAGYRGGSVDSYDGHHEWLFEKCL